MSVKEAKGLPCRRLPAARNSVFYGREKELSEIESKIAQQAGTNQPASLAIYGLGGVGKTQVALHYALDHLNDFDAVLWFHAETESSLRSSFSDAAVRLQLHDDPGDHVNNRTRVLLWLQKTMARWLIVYDNVESSTVLNQFWPIATQGQVLVTSRKSAFSIQPATDGIEILPFTIEIGRDYLIKFLMRGKPEVGRGKNSAETKLAIGDSLQELEAAKTLSEMMGGHPLALTQVASIGFKSHWSPERLLKFCQRNPKRVREKINPELLHAGYNLSTSTVFSLSFKELSPESFTLLSIVSFYNPNGISESMFAVNNPDDLPERLNFLLDEFHVSEYIEELLDLSLIHRTPDSDCFSIHRLVQSECKYFSDEKCLQESYNLATHILCAIFPKQDDERYGARLAQCARYIHHVFALRDNLAGPRGGNPLTPSDEFCILMRNASWYCVEIHFTKELEPTVTVAMEAAKETGFADREQKHYAQLCNCASRLWAQRGNFLKALKLMKECKEIRVKIQSDVWSAINNLGNIYMSMGDTKKALETHQECASLFDNEATAPKHALRTNKLNLGRTLTVLGKFSEAQTFIDEADRLNDDWLMGAHINYHRSLLLRAQGKFDLAIDGFQACIEAIERGTPYQSLLHAACLYKIGCIQYQKGDYMAARHRLQNSHDIHKMRESSPCELARVKYMLSLSMDLMVDKTEVEKRQRLYEEALKIREDLSGAEVNPTVCEDLFDKLVEGQLR
ncbi:P-loop containing nucleoside triphosphate hydrolase protein [Hypoxylon rubiginosum]|uniref:P-loop containing nucleoside triphosphate hydrolase protein n=1 Tax=Hypoxylon rubiginosum TaxID=110542 RepID=A0ACC0DA10_9PEZI|nr:P-loop containing nucleoside triphosphate hydrolase protein [Hypoxylon rubiginosum]